MTEALSGVHEMLGVGTLFTDEEGKPVVHVHAANGRGDSTKTGCIRRGVVTWQTVEVILYELKQCSAKRVLDRDLGFSLLQP